MIPVLSTNVAAYMYDPVTRTLTVNFLSGGLYEYYDVHSALAAQFETPYPWRRVGKAVMSHRYRRLA